MHQLTDKLLLKENKQGSETYIEPKTVEEEPIIESASRSSDHQISLFNCKQEDLCSAKSDVIDSDSPQYVDATHHSTFAEPGESSYPFEADHSDISQDDEDYLNKSLLPSSHVFSEIGDVDYPDRPTNSCYYGLSGEDHASLYWPYYWDINLKM